MARQEILYTFGYGGTGEYQPGQWLTPICDYTLQNQNDPQKSLGNDNPYLYAALDYIENGGEGYACTGASGAPEGELKYQLYKCYLARINQTVGEFAVNPDPNIGGELDPYIKCVDNLPSTPPF